MSFHPSLFRQSRTLADCSVYPSFASEPNVALLDAFSDCVNKGRRRKCKRGGFCFDGWFQGKEQHLPRPPIQCRRWSLWVQQSFSWKNSVIRGIVTYRTHGTVLFPWFIPVVSVCRRNLPRRTIHPLFGPFSSGWRVITVVRNINDHSLRRTCE
jgi:hypothetical protein